MFNRKKQEPKWTTQDENMRELYNRVAEARVRLDARAIDTYFTAEALKVYNPDDPEYKQAKKELEEEQYKLKCAIGTYDNNVSTLNWYYANNCDNITQYQKPDITSSHKHIVWAIRNYLRK